jgi:hypothetical protein
MSAPRFVLRLVALTAIVLVTSSRPTLGAFDDNLGFNWTSTAPAGYNVQLDAMINTLRGFPGGTDVGIPIKLVQPNWNTLDPIMVQFTPAKNPDPASPAQNQRFMFLLNLKNTTNQTWIGFKFQIVDNNGTDFPNQKLGTGGNLLHPDRAHFHADSILPGAIGFTVADTLQIYTNGSGNVVNNVGDLTATSGVYTITMHDGFQIKPGDSWNPLFYDAANPNDASKSSFLDIHDKIKPINGGTPITAFTVILTPITGPEPSSLTLSALGAGGMLFLGRRFKRRTPRFPAD